MRGIILKIASLRLFQKSTGHVDPAHVDRTRRHILTVVTNVAARGIGLGTLIASLRIALPYLGAERYGIFAAVAGLASALTFMDLGIGNGLVTRVAQLRAVDDQAGLKRLSGSALIILIVLACIVSVIGLLLVLVSPVQLLFRNLPLHLFSEARWTLISFSILLAVSIPSNAASRIFFGMQEGYIANAVSAVVGILSFCAVVALPLLGFGAPALLLVTFGAEPVSGVILLSLLWRRGNISTSGFSLRAPDVKSLFRSSRDFTILQIGGLAGAGADGFIISSLLGPSAVTQYSVCQRIFMFISTPLHILNAPLWAAYADADAKGDAKFIRRALAISIAGTALVSAAGGGAILLWGSFIVRIITGGAIVVPHLLLVTFAAWTVLETTGMALAMYMNGRGVVSPQAYVVLPFVAISLLFKFFLLPQAGVSWLPAISGFVYLFVVVVPYLTIFRRRLFPLAYNGRLESAPR